MATQWRKLRDRTDVWFSRWVRLSHANEDLQCECCTCGNTYHVKDIDCGHFVGRSVLATRWHLHNCAPQCSSCNRFKGGDKLAFTRFLRDKYGQEQVDALLAADARRNQPGERPSIDDLEELLEMAKDMCQHAADEKGIDLKELNWR